MSHDYITPPPIQFTPPKPPKPSPGENPARWAALALIGVSALGYIAAAFLAVLSLTTEPDIIGDTDRGRVDAIVGAFYSVACLASSSVILAGSLAMLSGRRYWLAMLAAITAAVPMVSPCVFIGMPVGIWAIIVLMDKRTKEAFGV